MHTILRHILVVAPGGTVMADGQRLQTPRDDFSTYGTTSARRGGSVLVSGG